MKRFFMFLSLALFAAVVRADNLAIENVTIAPRDAKTAIVKFDIAWTNSWCWGNFHDAAWVFFKVKPAGSGAWQHARLVADPPSPGRSGAAGQAVNPSGFLSGEGTALDFVVPSDRLGVFVRLSKGGSTMVAAKGVTVLCEASAADAIVRGCAIEMVHVGEGAYYLGSGGADFNRLFQWTDGTQESKPYRVTSAGPIPTGRQKDKLWASAFAPEDGGEIPASFPNGYAAFYVMKQSHITLGQYATFVGTLPEAEANKRYYPGFLGDLIKRSGAAPDWVYSVSAPSAPCPWLSWLDGATFAAWAGLRPMTELEYEKALRGQDYPESREVKPSYWGLAGANQEAFERVVSIDSAVGRKFAGTHGQGTAVLPADWPKDLDGVLFRGKPPERYYASIEHLKTSGRINALDMQMIRHPKGGWRAARTAPPEAATPVSKRLEEGVVRPLAVLAQPPRLDAVPEGWGEPLVIMDTLYDLFPTYFRFVPFDFYGIKPPWKGPQDLSATAYLASDKDALYFAAVVNDDRHINTELYDGISGADSIQIGLVNPRGTHWNFVLALTTNGVNLHQYVGGGEALLKTANCAVTRDDKAGVTRYGLRMPLAAFNMKPGDEFGINWLVLDSDDGKRVSFWLRPAAGIEYPWKPELYPRFVLSGK